MTNNQQLFPEQGQEETLTQELFERLVASKSAAFAGLPGPVPSFPLGNAGDFIGQVPWKTLSDYAERYGSMCLLWLGTSPQVLVTDPDLVWRVLEGDFDSYYKDSPCKALEPILSDANAFVNNGEAWRIARENDPVTVAAPPPQHGGPAKLPPLDIRAAHTLVNSRVKDLVAQTATTTIDLRPWMIRLVFDLFSIQAVGKLMDDDVFEEYLDLTETANDRMTSLYVLKALSPLSYLRRRKFRSAFGDLVSAAKKNPDEYEGTFLAMSMARGALDDETLAAQMGNFFFGGAQSVPAAILGTLYGLAQNPAAYARVHAEVQALFARNPSPSVAELDACTELDHALLEGMRLYPPAPVYMRNTDKDRTVELGGRAFPPDTVFFICTYAMQRSPQHWSNPNEFVPERWANGGKERDPLGSGWYFPFGRGRRACLGQTIGLIDMKLVLATILAHGMPQTEPTYVEESYFGVLQPKTMHGRLVAV